MIPPTRRQIRTMNEIRRIRREMRLNLYDFAELMGVHRDTICAWENGRKDPLRLKGSMLYIWWNGSIEAALIANRIIQAAFSEG